MKQEINGFTREIKFEPAFDKRSEGYGRLCVNMRFHLIGEKGVVQFVLFTGWDLSHVREEDKRGPLPSSLSTLFPMAADLGYHSPVPMYEGQTITQDDCSLIGGPCYYDGSTLNAEPVLEILISQGEAALWKRLEQYYHHTFTENPNE